MSISCTDFEKGQSYFYKKKYDDAISSFQSALVENKNSPDVAKINTWLGKCYLFKNKFDSVALDYFDAAIRNNSSDSEPFYWKGKLYSFKKNNSEAYKFFIQAAQISPSKYIESCADFFNDHFELPFVQVRKLASIEKAIEHLFCSKAYYKIEGLNHLLTTEKTKMSSEEVKKIESAIQPLLGTNILGKTLPFTGDKDPRVKELALQFFTHFN